MGDKRSILMAVTIDGSLQLLSGFPGHLAQHGWEVHVVSGPGPNLEELSADPGVHTHALPMRRDPSPLADLVALLRWFRLLRTVRPQIVSAGTPKAGLLCLLAARILRVPHRVYVLRGLRLESATGAKRRLLTGLEKLAIRCSTVVLPVSRSLSARAVELGLAKPDKLIVIGGGSSNGVDVERFNSSRFSARSRTELMEELGLLPGIPVIGYVGRLTQDKGVDVLLEALELMTDEETSWQALVVGANDDVGSSIVNDLADAHQVTVVPRVADPAPYYSVMDVFCLPTLREGFPNVVLEAAASGVAIVTTDATGAVDSVDHGVNGLIATAGSAASLSDNLRILLDDPGLRTRLGAAARANAVTAFDRRTFWQLHEEFLLTL